MANFPASALGNPARSQRRIAEQGDIQDYDPYNTIRDFRHFGGAITVSKGAVDPLAFDSTGVPLPQLPGKTSLPPFSLAMGDVDSTNYGQLHVLANLLGGYDITDNTTWKKWKFGPDGGTTADSYLKILDDNDHTPRMKLMNVVINSITVAVDANGNYRMVAGGAGGRYDFFSDPTQVTTAGDGVDPTLLGAYQASFTDAGDVDVFVDVTAFSAGVATIRCKIGAGAAYSNTQSYTVGDPPLRLQKEDGTPAGDSFGEPLLFYMPASAVPAATDEWRWDHQRSRWSQSLAARQPIPAVNTQFYLDDNLLSVNGGWSLTIERDLQTFVDPSQKQGAIVIPRSGLLRATLTLNRVILNSTYQAKLHNQDSVSIVLDGQTDSFITGAIPYVGRFVMPAMQLSGDMYSTDEGVNNKTESFTLTAGLPDSTYTFDGDSFDSSIHAVYHNNLASL